MSVFTLLLIVAAIDAVVLLAVVVRRRRQHVRLLHRMEADTSAWIAELIAPLPEGTDPFGALDAAGHAPRHLRT